MMDKLIGWRQNLEKNKFKQIDTLFLDEFHERSFHMDTILGCLKEMQESNFFDKYIKVVLSSATMD